MSREAAKTGLAACETQRRIRHSAAARYAAAKRSASARPAIMSAIIGKLAALAIVKARLINGNVSQYKIEEMSANPQWRAARKRKCVCHVACLCHFYICLQWRNQKISNEKPMAISLSMKQYLFSLKKCVQASICKLFINVLRNDNRDRENIHGENISIEADQPESSVKKQSIMFNRNWRRKWPKARPDVSFWRKLGEISIRKIGRSSVVINEIPAK